MWKLSKLFRYFSRFISSKANNFSWAICQALQNFSNKAFRENNFPLEKKKNVLFFFPAQRKQQKNFTWVLFYFYFWDLGSEMSFETDGNILFFLFLITIMCFFWKIFLKLLKKCNFYTGFFFIPPPPITLGHSRSNSTDLNSTCHVIQKSPPLLSAQKGRH